MSTRNAGPAGPKGIALCALAWLLGLLLLAPAASAKPKWGADYFPNVELTTHEGKQVRFYDDLLKGKAVAINIIYTSCTDECPLETARMAEVQRLLGERMGRDIFFYSISIDPARDTPQVLKAYAQKFGVGPGWVFLTGRKEDIRVLTRKLGLSRSSDAFNRDGHASHLMLGHEPSGQWMRNSAVDNPRFLAATMGNFFGWKDLVPATPYQQARPIDLSRAEIVFQSRCAACHTVGGGDRIGPDLLAVTSRRERNWLARYLKEPEVVRASGDPIARELHERFRGVPMPNLALPAEDIHALLEFLEARRQAAARQARAQATPTHRH